MQINRTQKPTLPQIVTVCKDLQTKQPKPSIDFPQNMRPNGVKFLYRILKQNQQGTGKSGTASLQATFQKLTRVIVQIQTCAFG